MAWTPRAARGVILFLVAGWCLGIASASGQTASNPAPSDTGLREIQPLSAPTAPVVERPLGFMVEWFRQGGIFMWPILLTAVLGLAVVFERLWTLHRARTDVTRFMSQVIAALHQGGVPAAREVCRRTRGPVAAVLHAGLLRAHQGPQAMDRAVETAGKVEMAFLQRGLVLLATVTNVAPLLGFLGTVSGMIHAFEAIAAAEQVSAKIVASGIAEALITTEAGLCVAIPIQSFSNYFISRIDRFGLEMEEASTEIVDLVGELGSSASG